MFRNGDMHSANGIDALNQMRSVGANIERKNETHLRACLRTITHCTTSSFISPHRRPKCRSNFSSCSSAATNHSSILSGVLPVVLMPHPGGFTST